MTYHADRCLIARAENACWDCGAIGQVVCLVLPHTLATVGEGVDDLPPPFIGAAVMSYIERLSPDLLAAIGTPHFKRSASRTAELTYYANHCEHCGTLIGDHYLTKPEGPFWPMTDRVKPIELVLFDQPVEVHGQCGSVTFPLGPHESEFEAPSPPRRPSRRKQRQ